MRTIYIDCSATIGNMLQTGIQRVVRNVVRHAEAVASLHGYRVKVVALTKGDFYEVPIVEVLNPTPLTDVWRRRAAERVVCGALGLVGKTRSALASLSAAPAWRDFINAPRQRFGLAWCVCLPVSMPLAVTRRLGSVPPATNSERVSMTESAADHSGDILLLPDSTWGTSDLWPAAERFRARGGYVAAVIYDLIPLTHPDDCTPVHVRSFTAWLEGSRSRVDFYICISHSTELELDAFLQAFDGQGAPVVHPKTGFFHLGSGLDLAQTARNPSRYASGIVAGGDPVFLVVGSLEPRKNIGFVLDAFDAVWKRNKHIKLVLVGHNISKAEDVLARIRHHPLKNSKLFWLRETSDTDLEYLYQKAAALVFASRAEGFGLPVVEALQRGLPVLCSDLPVLREVADGKARFFRLENTNELSAAVEDLAARATGAGAPARIAFPWLTWRESCDWLLRSVISAHQESLGAGRIEL
jgi:glycosyltransferase involved in cell wall biosynthesis